MATYKPVYVFIENYANLKKIVLCCAMTFELGKINVISSLCFLLILFGLNKVLHAYSTDL